MIDRSTLLAVKSALVASPLEGAAKKIQSMLIWRRRRAEPELTEIFLEDARTEQFLKRILRPQSCCVDVGCHIGSFLSTITSLCPVGHHTAIEASPSKAEWLRRKFPQVKIHAVAVGKEEGEATFFEERKRPGFSRLGSPSSDQCDSYQVQITTLDRILADSKAVDFIKLDVEGAELNALMGATKTIAKHRPYILFECGSEDALTRLSLSRQDLFEFITDGLGYAIFTLPDYLHAKGKLGFDEFRKCGLYPFRAFNFLALPDLVSVITIS